MYFGANIYIIIVFSPLQYFKVCVAGCESYFLSQARYKCATVLLCCPAIYIYINIYIYIYIHIYIYIYMIVSAYRVQSNNKGRLINNVICRPQRSFFSSLPTCHRHSPPVLSPHGTLFALSESKCSMCQPSCTIGKCIAMFLQNPVCIMNVGHLGNGD